MLTRSTETCENLNIEVLKTGAESPFQNGLCERNHAVVDGMLEKLIADNPEIDLDIALASAVCAWSSYHSQCLSELSGLHFR